VTAKITRGTRYDIGDWRIEIVDHQWSIQVPKNHAIYQYATGRPRRRTHSDAIARGLEKFIFMADISQAERSAAMAELKKIKAKK
jgi:hypothetical protein